MEEDFDPIELAEEMMQYGYSRGTCICNKDNVTCIGDIIVNKNCPHHGYSDSLS